MKRGCVGPRNPHMDDIIALWHTLDPKPHLQPFIDMCAERGWHVKRNTLSMWRARGLLPGELPFRPLPRPRTAEELAAISKPRQLASVVQDIVQAANTDAKQAAALNVVYSKELLQQVAAKTLMCAAAFIDRVSSQVESITIETPSDLATVANIAMQVFGKAAEVSDSLQLLNKSEQALDTAKGEPTSLAEWRRMQERGSAGKA